MEERDIIKFMKLNQRELKFITKSEKMIDDSLSLIEINEFNQSYDRGESFLVYASNFTKQTK